MYISTMLAIERQNTQRNIFLELPNVEQVLIDSLKLATNLPRYTYCKMCSPPKIAHAPFIFALASLTSAIAFRIQPLSRPSSFPHLASKS